MVNWRIDRPLEDRLLEGSIVYPWSEYEGVPCRIWAGKLAKNGYGKIRNKRRGKYLVHRVAYEVWVGPIPDGLIVDHLCRQRSCIEPTHLEAVTYQINTRRGISASKSHCVGGHLYIEDNTYTSPRGHRNCRECRKISDKKRRNKGLTI